MPDELLVLGSGSGVPTKYRFASAYALNVTGKLFLIDCGAPVSTLLYRYGLDPTEVQAVFLSHWHLDHVTSLGLLLAQNHEYQRVKALHIYGPRGTRGKIRRLLVDSFLLPEEFCYKLKLTNVKLDKTYKEALVKITYFKTRHLDQPNMRARFGRQAVACGMVINGPGWRVVYSGDLHSPSELVRYVEGCDLLIHEMAHHKPEAVAEFAAEMKIPRILISHIGPKYDESPEKIVAAFSKCYDGKLMIAEDGTKVRLNRLDENDKTEMRSPSSARRDDLPDTSKAGPAGGFRQSFIDSASARFVELIENEFDLSRPVAYEILNTAQEILVAPNLEMVQPGQMRAEVACRQPHSDQPPAAAEKVTVTLTINAGDEDIEVSEREGAAGLRRGRIVRITAEALEQGGLLTQNDLAKILNVNIRTVGRDLQALRSDGHWVPTYGQLKEGSSGKSYKVRVVELWLNRRSRDKIAGWLHCSPQEVERYISQFLQTAELHQEEMPGEEIADLLQLPMGLVQNYITLFETAVTKPHQRAKLAAEMNRADAQLQRPVSGLIPSPSKG